MADVVVTLKIMPEGTDTDLTALRAIAEEKIKAFAGEGETKSEEEPIAFGLKALKIIFVMDEEKGSTESLEQDIAGLDMVNSAEVIDVRRALG